MPLESLFVLPEPKVIERVSDSVNLRGADERCADKARAWLDAEKKVLRYDLFEGKMPVVLFTDANGGNLPIPEFLGVKIDATKEQLEVHNLDAIYRPRVSTDSFCYQYHGNGIIAHFGTRYDYNVGLKDGKDLDSIHLDVNNRYVFGKHALQSIRPRGVYTCLSIWKGHDDQICHGLTLVLPVGKDRVTFKFGDAGKLEQMRVGDAAAYRGVDELTEWATFFKGKTVNTATLRGMQSEAVAYQKAMDRFKKCFGDVEPLDYTAVLNSFVG